MNTPRQPSTTGVLALVTAKPGVTREQALMPLGALLAGAPQRPIG